VIQYPSSKYVACTLSYATPVGQLPDIAVLDMLADIIEYERDEEEPEILN